MLSFVVYSADAKVLAIARIVMQRLKQLQYYSRFSKNNGQNIDG
jgi:hypothetical protein